MLDFDFGNFSMYCNLICAVSDSRNAVDTCQVVFNSTLILDSI